MNMRSKISIVRYSKGSKIYGGTKRVLYNYQKPTRATSDTRWKHSLEIVIPIDENQISIVLKARDLRVLKNILKKAEEIS